MSANSLPFAGLSVVTGHAPVDRDALSVATVRLASALDLRKARLSWTAKKRARRAFKENLLHEAIRDPAMESLSLSDDDRLWYINLQFGSLSPGYDDQRRWQTVIADASVRTAMLSFAADVGAQMGLVSACVAGYRDHWYARHEGTLVEIEGHVEPPNDRRLGEDAMLSHRAQTRLRRLYPITIIGPELWAQLPPMPGLMKALRLYRGRGIQLWLFCQGRFSLQERFPPEVVKEIEDQVDVLQLFSPEEPSLLKDIETWSGKTTVAIRGINRNGGQVEGLSMGISEQARPVLQAEDIRLLGDRRQLLKLPGFPLFVADRIPFYEIDPFRDRLGDVREVARGDVVLKLEGES